MGLDLVGKIQRGLKKPPAYIVQRIVSELERKSDRWRAPGRAAAATEARVLAELGFPSLEAAWDGLTSAPFPFLTDAPAETLEAAAPGETARILAEAEAALAHRIDLMGSGPVELGPAIDWHTDFKTGRTWPPAFCHGIDYANLDQPSDVKSPWELSRLQWLIPAAQAWRLTREPRFAEGVRAVLEAWIDENPYAGSVNWSCTMEAALRLFSLPWLMRACADSQAFADPAFRSKLLRCLYLHADFTERYIERSDVNGNHYTADAAGLVFAGCFLGEGPAPRRWLETGWRILAQEIEIQVFPDGVDFEASVPYHRLVMELFLLPAIYGMARGRPLPPAWRDRLAAMARFVAAYSRSDGSVPIWGDNDDARALPMAGKGLFDHRYLIGLAGLALDDETLLEGFWGPVGEIWWAFGPEAAARLNGRSAPPRSSARFDQGGFYVLAGGEDHVFVDCGPLGLAGRGGHGHNDLMSFEAALCGQRLVVDPGCYLYTASPAERNAFRSTAYHNTPQVAGAEINRFIRPDYLWNLHCDARPGLRSWSTSGKVSALEMTHDGYQRLSPPVTPVRRIALDHARHSLRVEDRFEGAGQPVRIPFHLAPEVEASVEAQGGVVRLSGPRGAFRLSWEGRGDWTLAVEAGRVAPSYGVVEASRVLVFTCADCGDATLAVEIRPDA